VILETAARPQTFLAPLSADRGFGWNETEPAEAQKTFLLATSSSSHETEKGFRSFLDGGDVLDVQRDGQQQARSNAAAHNTLTRYLTLP
jgi:hypothetical protein